MHKKDNGVYVSDFCSQIKYKVGVIVKESCDNSEEEDCGRGIHIAHLYWALEFGRLWHDLAILEVETKIESNKRPSIVNECNAKVIYKNRRSEYNELP